MSLESFHTLLAKKMSEEDIREMHLLKDSLGIKTNDVFWSILMVFQHYKSLYEKIPREILLASEATKKASEKALLVQMEENKDKLLSTLSGAVKDVSKAAAKTSLRWATGICLGIAFLVLLGFGALSYSYGEETGYTKGLLEASTQEVRASFANTPEGILAYELAKVGSLRDVVLCSRQGWKKDKDGICYPFRDKEKKLHGWRVP